MGIQDRQGEDGRKVYRRTYSNHMGHNFSWIGMSYPLYKTALPCPAKHPVLYFGHRSGRLWDGASAGLEYAFSGRHGIREPYVYDVKVWKEFLSQLSTQAKKF